MLYMITGALGHLGYNIVLKLIEEKIRMRVLVLPGSDISPLNHPLTDVVYGDVTSLDDLNNFFDLSNTSESYANVTVIHCAGIISISNKYAQNMYRVNVDGTKNMLDFSFSKGVSHFIYISSVHAIRELPKRKVMTEITQFNPKYVYGHYGKSKALATSYVKDYYLKGYPITIIHPSGIIGPNDLLNGHTTELIKNYLNKKISTRVTGGYDFVDVRDVAESIISLSKLKKFGFYILSNRNIKVKEIFETLKKISGRKTYIKVLSLAFVRLLSPIIESYYQAKKRIPLFTNYSLYTLSSNALFSHEKLDRTINYQPRSLEVTLLDTAKYLIETNQIKDPKIIRHIQAYNKDNA